MTTRDEDVQREVDRAVRHWTRLLTGRLVTGIDAADLARRGVEAMLAERWRPPLQPPPDWRHRRDQPPALPTPEWREAAAKIRGDQQ